MKYTVYPMKSDGGDQRKKLKILFIFLPSLHDGPDFTYMCKCLVLFSGPKTYLKREKNKGLYQPKEHYLCLGGLVRMCLCHLKDKE